MANARAEVGVRRIAQNHKGRFACPPHIHAELNRHTRRSAIQQSRSQCYLGGRPRVMHRGLAKAAAWLATLTEIRNTDTEVSDIMSTDDNTVTGTENSDSLKDETLNNDAVMHGLGGDDFLYGWEGNDQLYGGSGDDQLYGGSGDDHLHGGAGNDVLYGEGTHDGPYASDTDADTYHFGDGSGQDWIMGFGDGVDKINLANYSSINQFSDLNISQNGSNAVIGLHNGDTITINNFSASDLDASDFVF